MQSLKKRRLLQAPFLFLAFFLAGAYPAFGDCKATRLDESVRGAQVLDGDTLRLPSGRKLRLIGVNAPELNVSQGAEPLASEARRFVLRFVAQADVLQLQYGAEKEDRYGRLLAHVFDGSGKSLEQALLEQGLAFQITVGRNDALQECLRSAEQSARQKQLGVWGQSYYQATPPGILKEGFRLVRGTVQNVHLPSRGSWWLDLDSGVSLVIRPADQLQFHKADLLALQGRLIEARGWLIKRKQGAKAERRSPWLMPLSHGTMVEIASTEKAASDFGYGKSGRVVISDL